MANTTYWNGNFISIVFDGSTDWDLGTEVKLKNRFPGNKIKVLSISVTAANGEGIVCRDVETADQASPEMLRFEASTGGLSKQYLFGGVICQPAFDAAEVDGGSAVIHYEGA